MTTSDHKNTFSNLASLVHRSVLGLNDLYNNIAAKCYLAFKSFSICALDIDQVLHVAVARLRCMFTRHYGCLWNEQRWWDIVWGWALRCLMEKQR